MDNTSAVSHYEDNRHKTCGTTGHKRGEERLQKGGGASSGQRWWVTCMHQVEVLIVEPVRLAANGLRHLLHDSPYVVVEEVQARIALFALNDRVLPDLVLLGPGTVPLSEAARTWIQWNRTEPRRSRFVALTDTTDSSLVRRLALSGIDAVLSQDISSEVLRRSLELVMLGQTLFPPPSPHPAWERPSIGSSVPIPFPVIAGRSLASATPTRERDVILSQRETQVLRWLVDGASNKVIAREMQITETTVKAHIKGLLRKIRATNRTQAAIWALENKAQILDIPDEPTVLAPAGTAGRYASL